MPKEEEKELLRVFHYALSYGKIIILSGWVFILKILILHEKGQEIITMI